MPRIYAAGSLGGGTWDPRVIYVDAATRVVTELPDLGTNRGRLKSIAVLAENDIWAGWDYSNNDSNYPKFGHWNGVSWVTYQPAVVPSNYEYYEVSGFHVVSASEIYAIVPPYYILKWNGSAWSLHINSLGTATIYSTTTIMPGSTGNDMWIANLLKGSDRVGHWNGSSFDAAEWANPGGTTKIHGLITYKSEIYAAANNGNAYVRTGPGAWALRFSVSYNFKALSGSVFWHDTEEDILWSGSYEIHGVHNHGISKYDGVTCTWYESSVSPEAQIYGISGIEMGEGNDARMFYSGLNSLLTRRPDNEWEVTSFGGGEYPGIDTLGTFSAGSRIYVSGELSGLKVGWIDSGTYDYIALPDPSGTGKANVLGVVAEDDIWIGIRDAPYPRVVHWDGAVWTTYDFDWLPYHANWYVVDSFLVLTADAVYCSGVDTLNGGRGRVWEWNGSVWADFADAGGSGQLLIMPGSTASDMWVHGGNISNTGLPGGPFNVAHWNGASFDEAFMIGGGGPVNGMCRRDDGYVYAAHYDSGWLYRRTGVDTWVQHVQMGNNFGAAYEQIWRNPETDDVWSYGWSDGLGFRVSKWNGATVVKEDPGLPSAYTGIIGLHEDGKTTIGLSTTEETVGIRIRHPDTGVWFTRDVGYSVYDLTLPALGSIPYLQNQDPAPDSTGNAEDAPVYLEIVDDNGDLNASTVDIYLDGALAWSSGAPQQPGWSGINVAVTDGRGYTISPWEYWDPGGHTVRAVAEDDLGNALDTSYVFSTDPPSVGICGRVRWGTFQWGVTQWGAAEVCYFSLVGVEPTQLSTAGGEILTATGTFSKTEVIRAHLGPLGTTEDPLCYGGQGLGYGALSLDGETLIFATPPLEKGTVTLKLTAGGWTQSIGGISVVERNWPGKLHRSRKSFAPWVALGARRLDDEIGE